MLTGEHGILEIKSVFSLPLKVNKSLFHYLKSYDLHYIMQKIILFYCSLVQLFPTYGLYPLQVGHEINVGDHEMTDGRREREKKKKRPDFFEFFGLEIFALM